MKGERMTKGAYLVSMSKTDVSLALDFLLFAQESIVDVIERAERTNQRPIVALLIDYAEEIANLRERMEML
jgi:hypothetical protein